MCCHLFKSGEEVKLANGNPTLGHVIEEPEPFTSINLLDQLVLVTWEEAVQSKHGYLVICQYYPPNELIRMS